MITGVGSTVTVTVEEQRLTESVTVQEYVPAAKPVAVDVV